MPESNMPRDADAAVDPELGHDETPDGADEPAGYENRAARRARGKGPAQQPLHGKAKHLSGRGSVPGPRQWGNRRSG